MRNRLGSSVALVAILLSGQFLSCAPAADPPPELPQFSQQDAEAIRANLRTYMAADPTEEPELFFSQFTDDIHFEFNGQEPWVGQEGLREVDWCPTLAGEVMAERVSGSGDLGYAIGTYQLSLDCGGDTSEDYEGTFLSVHRRQADGSWKMEAVYQG